jgi:hypothetical protein
MASKTRVYLKRRVFFSSPMSHFLEAAVVSSWISTRITRTLDKFKKK